MRFRSLNIEGSFTVELDLLSDNRGFFSRTFCKKAFFEFIGREIEFVQINHSYTRKKGALRGMHFQNPPFAEDKLIRCVDGEIFDVIVDLRKGSPTFLKWTSIELNKDNGRMVFIPKGCAHGFQTLSNEVHLIYHHTEFYSPNHDSGLNYQDPSINIAWPADVTCISEKDKMHDFLKPNFEGLKI